MLKMYLGFYFLFFISPAWSQTPSVVSHYPSSAYVVERLLPFTVESSGPIKIFKIIIEEGSSCSSLLDPYYPNTFHLYCRRAERPQVYVTLVDRGGHILTLSLGRISVALQRAPGTDNRDGSSFFGDDI